MTSFLSRFDALPQQPFDDNVYDNQEEEDNENNQEANNKRIKYSKEFLLSLQNKSRSLVPPPCTIPNDIKIDQQAGEDEEDEDDFNYRRGGRGRFRGSGGSYRGRGGDVPKSKRNTAAWFNEKVNPQDSITFDSSSGLTSDELDRKKAFEEFRKMHSFKASAPDAPVQSVKNNDKSLPEHVLTEEDLLEQQSVKQPQQSAQQKQSTKPVEGSKFFDKFNIENLVMSKLNKQQEQQSATRFTKFFANADEEITASSSSSSFHSQQQALPSVSLSAPPVFSIPTPKLEDEDEDEPAAAVSQLHNNKPHQQQQLNFWQVDDQLQRGNVVPLEKPQARKEKSILDFVNSGANNNNSSLESSASAADQFKDASSLEEELLKTLNAPASIAAPLNKNIPKANNNSLPIFNQQHQNHHHAPHHHHHHQQQQQQQQHPFAQVNEQQQFDMNAFFSRYKTPSAPVPVDANASNGPIMDASSIEQQLLQSGGMMHPQSFQHHHFHHHHHQQQQQFGMPPSASSGPANQYQQYLYQQQLRGQQQLQQQQQPIIPAPQMQPQPIPQLIQQQQQQQQLPLPQQQPPPPAFSEQNFPPLAKAKPKVQSKLIPTQTIKKMGKPVAAVPKDAKA